jgi:diguanylate cyclase (GGDEF)-like protein
VRTLRDWLEARTTGAIIGLGLLLLALVAGGDYVTGTEVSFGIFYLIPLSLVTWYAGRRLGVLMAVLAALVGYSLSSAAIRTYSSVFIMVWSPITRIAMLTVIALILSALRSTVVQLAASLERERDLSRHDALTGVRNIRAFRELVEQEISRAARYTKPLTLCYLDADGFKAVNDGFGHSAGDRVLRAIAQALAGNVRAVDVVARLGGDEFGVLLPEAGEAAARATLAKLTRALGEAMVAEGQRVTFSIGAVVCAAPHVTVDQLVKRADELMLVVKHEGKNGFRLEPFEAPVPAIGAGV